MLMFTIYIKQWEFSPPPISWCPVTYFWCRGVVLEKKKIHLPHRMIQLTSEILMKRLANKPNHLFSLKSWIVYTHKSRLRHLLKCTPLCLNNCEQETRCANSYCYTVVKCLSMAMAITTIFKISWDFKRNFRNRKKIQ